MVRKVRKPNNRRVWQPLSQASLDHMNSSPATPEIPTVSTYTPPIYNLYHVREQLMRGNWWAAENDLRHWLQAGWYEPFYLLSYGLNAAVYSHNVALPPSNPNYFYRRGRIPGGPGPRCRCNEYERNSETSCGLQPTVGIRTYTNPVTDSYFSSVAIERWFCADHASGRDHYSGRSLRIIPSDLSLVSNQRGAGGLLRNIWLPFPQCESYYYTHRICDQMALGSIRRGDIYRVCYMHTANEENLRNLLTERLGTIESPVAEVSQILRDQARFNDPPDSDLEFEEENSENNDLDTDLRIR